MSRKEPSYKPIEIPGARGIAAWPAKIAGFILTIIDKIWKLLHFNDRTYDSTRVITSRDRL